MNSSLDQSIEMNLISSGKRDSFILSKNAKLTSEKQQKDFLQIIYNIQKLIRNNEFGEANTKIKNILENPIYDFYININNQELQKLLPNLPFNIKPHILNLFGVKINENKTYDVYAKKYLFSLMLTTSSEAEIDFNLKVDFAFKIHDINNDGFIMVNELEEMLISFNEIYNLCFDPKIISLIVKSLFEEMDPLNTGQISKENFTAYLHDFRQKPLKASTIPKELSSSRSQTSASSQYDYKKQILADVPSPSIWKRLKIYYEIEGKKLFCVIIWVLMNISVFTVYFTQYYHGFLERALAKGFSGMIQLNMSLMLLFVCKTTLTIIRSSFLRYIIPLHKNVVFHKHIAAWVVLVCAPGHILSHLFGTYPIISSFKDLASLNQQLYSSMNKVPTYTELLYIITAGWTGIIITLLMIMIVLTAFEKIRHKNYEVFWYTHQLYIVCFGLLNIHGYQQIVAKQTFYIWTGIPCLILLLEKIFQLLNRCRYNFNIISLQNISLSVIELKLSKNPKHFNFSSGQYAKINIPIISKYQWHPFTISSTPQQQDQLVFNISPVGEWTQKLSNLAYQYQSLTDKPTIEANIEGPFGTPAQHYYEYEHLILIATGIGATPFSSILREILHRKRYEPLNISIKTVSFYWVNRSTDQAQWLTSLISEIAKDNTEGYISINVYFTQPKQKYDFRSFFLWNGLELMKSKGYTNQNDLASNSYWGRPRWDLIFQQKCLEEGEKQYGVFVCGNKIVCREVYECCLKYSRFKKIFKFTKEVF